MYLIYDLIWVMFLLGMLPVCLMSPKKTAKYRRNLKSRLGLLDDSQRQTLAANRGQWVWMHAVSVGEVAAVVPLLRSLKQKHPEIKLLVSTVTETGQELARKRLDMAEAVIYFPLDISAVAGRLIEQIRPKLFIMAETEIWPNFLHQLKIRHIPAISVNGRISDKSWAGYGRVKFFIRHVLENIDHFSMRTPEDARRIISVGARPDNVSVSGNIKFDGLVVPSGDHRPDKLLAALGIPGNAPVLIAGSTHPGEEEILLAAYGKLLAGFAQLRFILVPRHLDRLEDIEKLVSRAGLKSIRKSKIAGETPPGTVILVDSIGELARLYSIAVVAFVGGSLVPKGGQNILEPAAWGKPILFGPHMTNFQHEAEIFLEAAAAVRVTGEDDLAENIGRLLADREAAEKMGRTALEIVEQNRGATERTIEVVERYLS